MGFGRRCVSKLVPFWEGWVPPPCFPKVRMSLRSSELRIARSWVVCMFVCFDVITDGCRRFAHMFVFGGCGPLEITAPQTPKLCDKAEFDARVLTAIEKFVLVGSERGFLRAGADTHSRRW